ncbi:MAG: HAMP domain-containing protein [Actinobacteria bacterium]|nr:HAMP domain-containing protein [Actinomycetota bacterium]
MALPVTIALVVVSLLGVSERLAERAAANRHLAALSLSAQTSNLVHELQTERLLAASSAAVGSGEATAALETQRRSTDEAVANLEAELTGFVGETLTSPEAVRSLDTLRSLTQATTEIRSGTARQTPLAVADQYSRLIDRATRAVGSVEFSDEAGGANSAAVSRRWLAQMVEAESELTAVGTAWYQNPRTTDGYLAMVEASSRLAAESDLLLSMFAEYGTQAAVDRVTEVRSSEPVRASDASIGFLADAPLELPETSPLPEAPADWSKLALARIDGLIDVEREALLNELGVLEQYAGAADREANWFGAGAAAAILGVALLALAVSRSINRSIRSLSTAAQVLSTEQVPALLESLKSPTLAAQGLSGIEIKTTSNDEFAEVGRALTDLSNAIVEVATEQHQQLRRGISDIFVNLARRNQSLLDRQIQFIDRLETNEEDPDQLENLFRLDHLATRMRRNAESLLVLAGAEAPRRRARNVEIGDVIRVAIGEVEDFARVDLIAVEPAIALGAVAVDIAHLLAELMENGAQYSPPETTVDVVGRAHSDGGYCIVIGDHGVGMAEERLALANDLLRNPPPVGLALSRSLGFIVAGTLAERHGITVTLTAGVDGGVVAEVTIPANLLSEPTMPLPQPETRQLPSRHADGIVVPIRPGSLSIADNALPPGKGVPGPAPRHPAATPQPAPPIYTGAEAFRPAAAHGAGTWSPERVDPSQPEPLRLDDRIPTGDKFDDGLYGLLGATPVADAPELPARRGVADTGDALPRRGGHEAVAGSEQPWGTPSATAPSNPLAGLSSAAAPLGDLNVSNAGWLPPLFHPSADDDPAFLPAPHTPGTLAPESATAGTAPQALPQRQPGTSAPKNLPVVASPTGDAVAPRRTDVDARSALSRYRSGLRTGRTDTPQGQNQSTEGEQAP